MKFHLFKYTCKKCGAIYKAPELSFDSYGEFLMRSVAGETVYLNAISDPVYDEVDKLLHELLNEKKFNSFQYANLLQTIFGVACDKDSKGNRYDIKNKPKCNNCRFQEPSYWEATEPPEFIELNIPEVEHNKWSELTKAEKLDILKKAIGELNLDDL